MTQLQCNIATMLSCYTSRSTLSHSYTFSMLHCDTATVLHCSCITLLYCNTVTRLHCYYIVQSTSSDTCHHLSQLGRSCDTLRHLCETYYDTHIALSVSYNNPTVLQLILMSVNVSAWYYCIFIKDYYLCSHQCLSLLMLRNISYYYWLNLYMKFPFSFL